LRHSHRDLTTLTAWATRTKETAFVLDKVQKPANHQHLAILQARTAIPLRKLLQSLFHDSATNGLKGHNQQTSKQSTKP
jgi:hypothetical protein